MRKVALSDAHVLVTGETGTGKELAAQYIHDQSARRGKPLMAINCAALPDGLLESELFGYERGAFTGAGSSYPGKLRLADHGTVLFDEIGDMSLYAQAKILRVIETKQVYPLGGHRSIPVDVRIIAATNRQLEVQMRQGEFRQDLYYRLNVVRINLPPLRDRKADIPLLIDYFVQKCSERTGIRIAGFSDEALEVLSRYDWLGNIRELMNLVERIFIDPPVEKIGVADLPDFVRTPQTAKQDTAPDEREILLHALSKTNWNKSKAAEQLHWSRMTLYRKLVKYRLVESQADRDFTWRSDDCNNRSEKVTKL
jgi:transcriptional regulator with PAS, ATPase and Fis domain